jgi:L-serine kinase (ATP) / ParB family transcriptional regulator, heme-responsive regulator
MTSQVHPLNSLETPDLRVVPLELLVEHEFNDAQRTAPLAKRLEAEGLLKNPPIVAPLDEGDPRFVVLDGANRTTALQMLGYPHVLVQVVQYADPPVTLSTWHHVVCGLQVDDFWQCIEAIDRLDFRAMDLLYARAGLARRDLLAYTICADGRVYAARTEVRSLHEQNALLNAMVDTYKDRGRLYRAATDYLHEARALYPDLTGLVIFPRYEASEVMALARDGELLPTGLTRHLIQGRVLRTNYPLSELRSPDDLEAKNARLHEWLQRKLNSKEMRFYGEATFLMDE